MLAECAERTSTAPISSQAARSAPSSTCSVTGSRLTLRPPCSTCLRVGARAPARRHDQRRLGQLARPPGPSQLAGTARPPPRVDRLAVEHGRRAPRPCRRRARRRRELRAGQRDGDPHVDELELAPRVGVAVALLVRRSNALAQLARDPALGLAVDRQLERLAARSAGRRSRAASACGARRARRGRARRAAPPRRGDRARSSRSSPRQQHALHEVAAALGDDEPERRQHARRAAGTSTRRMPSSSRDRAACSGPAPPNAHQRELARVDAALDRHHAHGPGHLRARHADDARRRVSSSDSPSCLGQPAHRALAPPRDRAARRRPAATSASR